MFNKYFEAEALSMLPAVLEHFQEITFGSGTNRTLSKLCTMFRFPLTGLSRGSLVCHLGQLEQLARYYMYGKSGTPDWEHANTQMRLWMKRFDMAVKSVVGDKKISRPLSSLDCTNYDLPFYQNSISLDGILANALAAGPFETWDTYPSCEHLQCKYANRMKGLNDAEKQVMNERFWKIQLAGLQYCICQGEPDSAKADTQILSVFCMMLDYAGKYTAYQAACRELGIEPELGIVRFPIETKYINSTLFPFSTAENFRETACLLPDNLFYGPVSVNVKNDTHNALGFLFFEEDFADSADIAEIISKVQLPDLCTLDDGTRLFPNEENRNFCEITLKTIQTAFSSETADDIPKGKLAPNVILSAMTAGMMSGEIQLIKRNRDYYTIPGLTSLDLFLSELRKRLKAKYIALVSQNAGISEKGKLIYRQRLARALTFAHLLAQQQLDSPQQSDGLPVQYYKLLIILCEDETRAEEFFQAEEDFISALETCE